MHLMTSDRREDLGRSHRHPSAISVLFPQLRLAVPLAALIVLGAWADVHLVYLLGELIEAVTRATDVRVLLTALTATALLLLGLRPLTTWLLAMLRRSLFAKLSLLLFDAVGQLPLLTLERSGEARIGQLYSADLPQILAYLTRMYTRLLPDIALFSMTVLFMLRARLSLGLLALLLSLPPLLLIYVQGRRLTAIRQEEQRLNEASDALVGDLAAQHELIAAYDLGEAYRDRYRAAQAAAHAQQRRYIRVDTLLDEPSILLSFLALIALGLYGFQLLRAEQITAAALISAILLMRNLLNPVMRFPGSLNAIHRVQASLGRWRDSVAAAEPTPAPATARWRYVRDEQLAATPAIVVEDLHFAWPDNAPLFDGLDFSVARGSCICLKGDVGTGKSTFAALLTGFFAPQRGRIDVALSERARSARTPIAYMSPQAELFHMTVLENMRLVNDELTAEALVDMLEQLGLGALLAALPEGVHTVLGDEDRRLSGGQAQLLALVRLMLSDAEILILDEPTASMDVEHVAQFELALARLAGQRSVVVISHDGRLDYDWDSVHDLSALERMARGEAGDD